MNYEMALANAVLDAGIDDMGVVLEQNIQNVFFEHGDLWEYIQKFYFDYKALPSKDVVKTHYPEFDFLDTSKLPVQYYIDEAKKLSLSMQFRQKLKTAAEMLHNSGPNVALNFITSQGLAMMRDAGTLKDTNLAGDYEDRVESFKKKLESDSKVFGVPSGIEIIDKVYGGWQGGDFIVILGWTGAGKRLAVGTPIATPNGWVNVEGIKI